MKVPRLKLAVDWAYKANNKGHNRKRVIVLHSTESHDREGVSDIKGVMSYLNNKGYGIHYVVDGEGNIGRGAYHSDLVYHCAGANSFAIGIEMIGEAKWPSRKWTRRLTREGRKDWAQVKAVARLIAYISDKEDIPLKLSTDHGVARHSDFPEGGHWDPGPGFPTRWVLRRARMLKRFYNSKG